MGVALLGHAVPTMRSRAETRAPRGLERERALGGAALVSGVQLLKLSRLLVVGQRAAVQLGGLPVQLAQARVGRIGHQALGAFGGYALAGGVLACAVTELLRAPSPLAMLLRIGSGHHHTVMRNAA